MSATYIDTADLQRQQRQQRHTLQAQYLLQTIQIIKPLSNIKIPITRQCDNAITGTFRRPLWLHLVQQRDEKPNVSTDSMLFSAIKQSLRK